MPDTANHDELRGAFVDLEEYAMPLIKLPGADQARVTVRRRRAGLTVLASAALLAIIASVATFAVTRNAGPEPGVISTSPSPSSTAEPAVPMQLLSDHQKPTPLDGTTLNLPDFHHSFCPKGLTQFHDRMWQGPGVPEVFEANALILDIVEGDVTGDGRAERIALFICNAGTDPGAYAAQVVAYTDAGKLLGQVTWVSGGQTQLAEPKVEGGKVRVLYLSTPDGGPITAVESRAFSWNGNRFAPAGTSPVQFDDQPSQLVLSAELSRFSRENPHATLAIRVENRGDQAPGALTITMYAGAPLTMSYAGTTLNSLAGTGVGHEYEWAFTIAGMAPGAAVEGTFDVTTLPKSLIGSSNLGVAVYAVDADGLPLPNAVDAGVELIVSH